MSNCLVRKGQLGVYFDCDEEEVVVPVNPVEDPNMGRVSMMTNTQPPSPDPMTPTAGQAAVKVPVTGSMDFQGMALGVAALAALIFVFKQS